MTFTLVEYVVLYSYSALYFFIPFHAKDIKAFDIDSKV